MDPSLILTTLHSPFSSLTKNPIPIRDGVIPRYHPDWLHTAAHSFQRPCGDWLRSITRRSCGSDYWPDGRSPERLGRELQPVSAWKGSQSMPLPPCRFPPTYFPSSKPLRLSCLYYPSLRVKSQDILLTGQMDRYQTQPATSPDCLFVRGFPYCISLYWSQINQGNARGGIQNERKWY
jgi:hypothetical protein